MMRQVILVIAFLFFSVNMAAAQTPAEEAVKSIIFDGNMLTPRNDDFQNAATVHKIVDPDLAILFESATEILDLINKNGAEIPANQTFKFYGMEPMTLAQVKAWAENIQKLAKNELYVRQGGATTDKVLAVLKNDKLKLYQTEVVRDSVLFYDGNGNLLKTPEDFAKAKYWIFPWTTYAGAVRIWKLQGYVFQSDMKLDKEFYMDGVGDSVPRTAWPKE